MHALGLAQGDRVAVQVEKTPVALFLDLGCVVTELPRHAMDKRQKKELRERLPALRSKGIDERFVKSRAARRVPGRSGPSRQGGKPGVPSCSARWGDTGPCAALVGGTLAAHQYRRRSEAIG